MSTLEQEILTLLLSQELYGLQIKKALQDVSKGICDVSCGSLYPTLERLEERSLVKGRWADDLLPRPRRKYYQITKDGANALVDRQRFLEALSQWQPKN